MLGAEEAANALGEVGGQPGGGHEFAEDGAGDEEGEEADDELPECRHEDLGVGGQQWGARHDGCDECGDGGDGDNAVPAVGED